MGRVVVLLSLVFCCLAEGSLGQVAAQSGRRQQQSDIGEQRGAVTPGAPVKQDDDVVRVRTDEILVPVTVSGFDGAPVNGLNRDDFLVFDNGVRHEIAGFNRQRVPANIVLLLDASGSVFDQMRLIREAAKGFLQGLLKEDQVCVMQFADKVELLRDWTSAADVAQIEKALDWRYHPGESTAFYDALYLAANEQLAKVGGRRIIILLTDGIDTAEGKGGANFTHALDAARRAEASIYVISLTASLRVALEKRTGGRWGRIFSGYDPRQVAKYLALIRESEERLTEIAFKTGGRIILPLDGEGLAPAYAAIAEELRTQYVITYKPQRRARPGEWRRIRVLVLGGGYEVRTREGYTGRS